MPPNDIDLDEPMELDPEEVSNLAGVIKGKFADAEEGKRADEIRWLSAYKNYRGITDSSTQYKSSEKSKVFLKITKVKVLAAYGQLTDILFANKKFPLTIEPTPVPEGVAEFAHLQMPQEQQAGLEGFQGDGKELLPGALEATVTEQQGDNPMLAGLSTTFGQSDNLVPGPGYLGQPQIKPAAETARKMEKVIMDQLLDTSAVNVLRHAIFECSLLGTGIIKGPFNYGKKVHRWKGTGDSKEYDPYEKTVPRIEAVSCWDFYPDPSATSIEDCEYVIQRHRMNREQVRDLMNRPYFNKEKLELALEMGPNYEERHFEPTIRSDNDPMNDSNRFEILEYWGILDATLAAEAGMEMPKNLSELTSVQVNIWVCSGMVIRAVVNPFTPMRIPYQAFPYELNPYQFFGVGVAENMEDAQLLMNGHMRMGIDNLALAGNLVFDVDEAQLVPGQSMEVYPGKIFRRQTGVTGTAINGLKFPNTAPENLQMYQVARQLADEETGIPSIVHGQTGVTGTGRTASGLSMLLGSAGLSIKTVIKNIDDYLLKPMGEAYFQWNMQFNDLDIEIVGDLEIKPKGVAAVMQKEVRSQRLTMLLQTVSNPMLAPFIKIPNLIREIAVSQDIDPDELVNDPNEAAIFADILKGMANEQGTGQAPTPPGQPPGGMAGAGRVPPGANPADATATGGGTIGVGNAPTPGEAGFAANTGQTEEVG